MRAPLVWLTPPVSTKGLDDVSRPHAQPGQQVARGFLAPDSCSRCRCRGAAHSHRRHVGTDERVEEGGLAAPGGARERDDGAVADHRGALADLLHHCADPLSWCFRQLRATGSDRRRQRRGCGGELLG